MKTASLYKYKPRALFISIAASFSIHAVALIYFYYHPFLLKNSISSLFGFSSAEPLILENSEEDPQAFLKDSVLEEALQKIVVVSAHFQEPYDLIALPQGVSLSPSREETTDYPLLIGEEEALEVPSSMENPTLADNFSMECADEKNGFSLFEGEETPMPIVSQLQIDHTPALAELPLVALPEMEGDYEDLIATSDPSTEPFREETNPHSLSSRFSALENFSAEENLCKLDPKPMLGQISIKKQQEPELLNPLLKPHNSVSFERDKNPLTLASHSATYNEYDFSDLSEPGEWNDDFDIDVVFSPNPEGKGYIFSLSLSSNYDLSSYSLKQNLYFIIDRSSTVQKHRFAVFKRAVIKALASMQQGDGFNIVILDKKLKLFSQTPCIASLKNIQAAEEFLDKQEAGSFFNSSDIYTSLDKILPLVVNDEQQHTAILLTDGKTRQNVEQKRKTLQKWTHLNQGKLSLYACAIGSDNDLISLDMLCSLSGGKLLYSDTHASFPRKLAKLVLDLRDPVAKDLKISAIPDNPDSIIELYSSSSPALYSKQPYLITGKIDEPCAFNLILQGRHRDSWIAIKKNVSFVEGHKGDHSFEKKWYAEHTHLCYSKFLKEGKNAYLKQAKEILKKSRHEVAFE